MKLNVTVLACLFCAPSVLAEDSVSTSSSTSNIGLGVKLGTTGVGLEGMYSINEYVTVRGHYTGYSDSFDESSDDIDFALDADIGMGGVLLDVHPFGGFFRVSVGLVSNANEFAGLAAPSSTYEIGDNEYTAEEIGELSANIQFKSTVPYVGFGWGRTTVEGFGFNFEVGAMLQDTPQISLSTTSSIDGLQDDLALEEQEFQESVEDFKFWPVVSIGLTYSF